MTILVVFTVAGFSLWHSWAFEECLHKIPADKAPEQYGHSLAFLTFATGEWFGCLGPFVDHNSDALIAVFTIILAVATVRLWVSTNRLWKGAEKSSEVQLRAYVLVEAGDIYDGSRIGVQSVQPNTLKPAWTNFPSVTLSIRNSGQTPAKNVRHWAKIWVSDAANEHLLNPPRDEDMASSEASVIGPRTAITKVLTILPFPLSEPVLSEIISGNKGIYVWGKILYEDVFGETRRSVYRLRYAGVWPPIPSGTMNFALYGNETD